MMYRQSAHLCCTGRVHTFDVQAECTRNTVDVQAECTRTLMYRQSAREMMYRQSAHL